MYNLGRLKFDLSVYSKEREKYQNLHQSTYYFPCEHVELKSIGDAELSQLIIEIKTGKQKKVNLKSCNLSDHQFVKVFIASANIQSETTEIDCSNNQISDNAILHLVNISFKNSNMKLLNLAHNHITTLSIDCFIKILCGNFFIIQVDLTGNPIDQKALSEIKNLLKRNAEIQHELGKIGDYKCVFDFLISLAYHVSLSKLVLDYFSDAQIPQAREIVSKILFQYPETGKKNIGIELVTADSLKDRMLQVAAEYNKFSTETMQALDTNVNKDELRFSGNAGSVDRHIDIESDNSSKNLFKGLCLSCCFS